MGYNHANEEKKFKEEWKQKEQLYRDSGMTDKQIAAIKTFDENMFNRDRAFYRRTMIVAEPESLTEGIPDDRSDTYLEEYWTELIDSEETYNCLMAIPPIMRKAFYMYKVLGLYQTEISLKLSIPQQTLSYWIVKIAEILK